MGYAELVLIGQALVFLLTLLAVRVGERRQRRIARETRDELVAHIDRKLAGDMEAAAEYGQPRPSGPHDHVWGPSPFEQDSMTKSFRCQVPRCSRIHTQSLR